MNGDNLGTIRGCGHTVCMHTTVDTLLTRDARKTKEIKAYVPANIQLYLDVKTMSTMPVLYIVDVHGSQSPFPGSKFETKTLQKLCSPELTPCHVFAYNCANTHTSALKLDFS